MYNKVLGRILQARDALSKAGITDMVVPLIELSHNEWVEFLAECTTEFAMFGSWVKMADGREVRLHGAVVRPLN
jgi:hypothetical protein